MINIGQTSDKQETLLMYAPLKVGEEIYNHKKIQLEINNEIIKPFKASNKAFEGMSDYKCSFYVK